MGVHRNFRRGGGGGGQAQKSPPPHKVKRPPHGEKAPKNEKNVAKRSPYKEQDAREAMRVVFSVLTKRICMHKTNFLRIYSYIVLKLILNCMNMRIATQLIMMYNL